MSDEILSQHNFLRSQFNVPEERYADKHKTNMAYESKQDSKSFGDFMLVVTATALNRRTVLDDMRNTTSLAVLLFLLCATAYSVFIALYATTRHVCPSHGSQNS